jgi:hypothetical protein
MGPVPSPSPCRSPMTTRHCKKTSQRIACRIVVMCLFFPVALQSLKDLGRLTYRRFLELLRHMVGLLGRVISPSQGLYLHRKTQHRKTRTNIHALSGIRTHDHGNQPAKTHASDGTATVTGLVMCRLIYYIKYLSSFQFLSIFPYRFISKVELGALWPSPGICLYHLVLPSFSFLTTDFW